MAFKDKLIYCEEGRRTFVYSVAQQRAQAGRDGEAEGRVRCTICKAMVSLADVPADDQSQDDRMVNALVREGCAFSSLAAHETGSVSRFVEQKSPSREKPRGKPKRRRGRRDGERRQPSGRGSRSRGRGGRGPRRRKGAQAPRQTELRIRHMGTVKWFDPDRGYGFIAPEEGAEVFVHFSGVLSRDPAPELFEGQPVEYEIEHTSRGIQAVDVVPLA